MANSIFETEAPDHTESDKSDSFTRVSELLVRPVSSDVTLWHNSLMIVRMMLASHQEEGKFFQNLTGLSNTWIFQKYMTAKTLEALLQRSENSAISKRLLCPSFQIGSYCLIVQWSLLLGRWYGELQAKNSKEWLWHGRGFIDFSLPARVELSQLCLLPVVISAYTHLGTGVGGVISL